MTFIIAEAGVNHDGEISKALSLISAARLAGADAVKFQLFSAEKLKRPELSHLELSREEMKRLYQACTEIEFLCTAFDVDSLKFLIDLGVKKIKIGSGSIADWPLLGVAGQSQLPVILSTGMSSEVDIRRALVVIGRNVTILHCTSAYPCPVEDVNLMAMDSLRSGFNLPVGYSDHTQGIAVSIAAAAKGATVIEKHLTLDKNAVGPDHSSSIEPWEFEQMVRSIRVVEKALGDGVKRIMPSEEKTRKIWGR